MLACRNFWHKHFQQEKRRNKTENVLLDSPHQQLAFQEGSERLLCDSLLGGKWLVVLKGSCVRLDDAFDRGSKSVVALRNAHKSTTSNKKVHSTMVANDQVWSRGAPSSSPTNASAHKQARGK